jgi:O-antigen ligase
MWNQLLKTPYSFLLIAFLLIPLANNRVFPALPVYLLDSVFLVLSGYILVCRHRIIQKEYRRSVAIGVALFILSTLLGILFSPSATAWGLLKSWIILPMVATLLFAVAYQTDSSRNKKALVIWIMGIVGVLLATLPALMLGIRTFDGRLEGVFTSPNFLGFFLFPGVLLSLWMFKTHPTFWIRQTAVALILSVAMGIFLTRSAGSSAAVLVSILTYSFLGIRQLGNVRRAPRGLLVSMLIVALLMFATFQEKLVTLTETDARSSFASRMMIWRSAGVLIVEHPVIGIGLGNFQQEYLYLQPLFPPYLEWAVPQPHNLVLALWLQGGLFGLLIMLFFWIQAMRSLERRDISEEEKVLAGIFVGILSYGIFDTPLFGNALALVYFLPLFLLLHPLKKEE